MEYSFIDVDSVADAEFDVTSRYCYSDFVCGIWQNKELFYGIPSNLGQTGKIFRLRCSEYGSKQAPENICK